MEFVKQSNVYNTYYPMFTIMIGTGLRCGELIGLTWKDINIKAKTVNVDHQLIYKNLGDGCNIRERAKDEPSKWDGKTELMFCNG